MIIKNCSIKSFFERCSNRNIACYGIGYDLGIMLKNYAEYPWSDRVKYLVDNSSAKWGTEYQMGDRRYEIMNLEQLRQQNTSELVILITCSFYAEIIDQLNQIPELDQVECYVYYFMYSISEYSDLQIRRRTEPLIPKVIHYCWFGGKELPDLYKKCVDSWHKFCPDYEIIEWNESNCDLTENLFAEQAYKVGKYGFVPDYFRLKIIYEHGGFYLDTDVELLKSLDDLRYNEAFCGLELPGDANLGLGFGAVAGNTVIKKMLDRYEKMHFLNEDGTYNEVISPVWQTQDLMELGMQYGNRLQEVSGMTIYPMEVLSPMNVLTDEICITDFSYAVHYFDGSWVSGERLERKKKRQANAERIKRMIQA